MLESVEGNKIMRTTGELQVIRSSKHPGDLFIKRKESKRTFICKFYACPNGKEHTANVEHFLRGWRNFDQILNACEKYGCHLDDCNLMSLIPIGKRNGIEVGCTCGWEETKAAIEKAKRKVVV
jgi:hypothetical protein